MKATYKNHLIEATRDGLNGWIIAINGKPSGIEPQLYRGVALRKAMRVIDEQEQTNKIVELKEIGL